MGIVITEATLISDDVEALERVKKEEEYYNYIVKHISFVKDALERYFIPLLDKNNICHTVSDDELFAAIEAVRNRVESHDSSKFLDDEFYSYRAKYYPTANESKGDSDYIALVDEKYNDAWKHHYTHNRHHPEYWVDSETGVPRDMELDAIVEMICDWEAVSTMFGTNTLEWYQTQAKDDEQKQMTGRTKEIVEDILINVLHK